jgi:hypothetical protein
MIRTGVAMNDRNRMGRHLDLEARGFRAAFQFQSAPRSAAHLDAAVSVFLPPELGGMCIESVPTFLSVADLGRLSDYLDNHLRSLQNGATDNAGPFVPLELGFQFEALDGDIDAAGEGELSLRLLINVGVEPAEETRVYSGVEGAIDARKLAEFAAQLRSLANEASSAPVEGAA